jgi:FkbM family methyltransferase
MILSPIMDLPWRFVKAGIYNILCGGDYQRYLRLKALVVRVAARCGLYEGDNLRLLKRFVHAGDSAIDVGAHYGVYTEQLSQLVRTGHVLAFEPLEEVYSVLETHLGKVDNVTCYNCAISDGSQEALELRVPYLSAGVPEPALATSDTVSSAIFKTYRVTAMKLDDVKISGRLAFVKIDVEGHEDAVLRGMQELIKQHAPVIQVEVSACNLPNALSPEPFGLAGYKLMETVREQLVPVTNPKAGGNYYLLKEQAFPQ